MSKRIELAGLWVALFAALLAAPAAQAQADGAREAAEAQIYQEAMEALAEGRRTDASELLRRLVANPQQAGALLDLALTQCGLGNADEAERLFAMLETRVQLKPDMMILIAETREAGCRPWKPASTTTLTVGRGIDQNVNQGAACPRWWSTPACRSSCRCCRTSCRATTSTACSAWSTCAS